MTSIRPSRWSETDASHPFRSRPCSQCPRCELGFTKSEACNKMTCPRDGYKMCECSLADGLLSPRRASFDATDSLPSNQNKPRRLRLSSESRGRRLLSLLSTVSSTAFSHLYILELTLSLLPLSSTSFRYPRSSYFSDHLSSTFSLFLPTPLFSPSLATAYCNECNKCDLNRNPKEDEDVQAAGAKARQQWERDEAHRNGGAGGTGGGADGEGVEWARNMRVGPMSDFDERESSLLSPRFSFPSFQECRFVDAKTSLLLLLPNWLPCTGMETLHLEIDRRVKEDVRQLALQLGQASSFSSLPSGSRPVTSLIICMAGMGWVLFFLFLRG